MITGYDHRQTFNYMLSRFGYSAKQIAGWSGIHESRISRFRNGKLDLETGEFLQLLQSMPEEAQSCFWQHLLGKSLSLEQMIKGMDECQLAALLHAIATNLGKSEQKALQLTPG